MIRPAVFDLLSELIEEHRRDRGAASSLIPCLHEELEQDTEVLSAGARRCGGTFYDLSTEHDYDDPPGPISEDRRSLVEGILSTASNAHLPAPIVIEEVDGRVVARLEGLVRPSEPSLVLVLRAVAIVASSTYDRHDLVISAASTAPTDPGRRELLWRLLTIDPTDLAIAGSPTTLVPILGAPAEPETDYDRVPEYRYIIRWDRVVRRTPEIRRRAIETILADDRPVVLFLGAGASASSGIRLGNVYRDLAIAELLGRGVDSDTAGLAFFDYLHEQKRFIDGESERREDFAREITLERVLRETFAELGYRPRADSKVIQEISADCAKALNYVRPGRKALRALASALHGRLIIMTVNFDQLIEMDLGTDHEVYSTPADFETNLQNLVDYVAGDDSKPVPVLKVHGTIDKLDSLIATIDNTSAGLQPEVRHALNEVLRTTAKPLTWLWIGCSMRDRDINSWLGGLDADALDEWWVDPLPGQPLDEFVARQRSMQWLKIQRELPHRLIVDSADGFLRALAEAIS